MGDNIIRFNRSVSGISDGEIIRKGNKEIVRKEKMYLIGKYSIYKINER